MGNQPDISQEKPEIREGDWCSVVGAQDRLIRIAGLRIEDDLTPNLRTQEYRRAPCKTLHLKEQENSPDSPPLRHYQQTYKRELGWCDICGEYGYFDDESAGTGSEQAKTGTATAPERILAEMPVNNKRKALSILIDARIHAAMTQLEKTQNADRAEYRLTDRMLTLSRRELERMAQWTYNRPREGGPVSEIVNQTATRILNYRSRREAMNQGP